MSMTLMVKALKTKVGNPLRKLVLLKLADNANDQGECWPSYQYIADQCEMSKRSVMLHINKLIEDGFLKKEHRLGGEKFNKSNLYTLMVGAGDSLGVVQEIHPPGAGDSLGGGAGDSPRTYHSLESINKPSVSAKPKPSKYKFNDDQMNFALAVYGKVKEVTPQMKEPNIDLWANTARLMTESDKFVLRDVWDVFCWANSDNFWRTNILSVSKLREKYPELKAKSGSGNSAINKKPVERPKAFGE